MNICRIRSWAHGMACLATGLALTAHANDAPPPAAQAWTPTSLRAALAELPSGDAQRGRRVHEELFCASCHGGQGQAPTFNWPHTASQRATYTAKMLLDYQPGLRRENRGAQLMHDVAVAMTPQQIADVAAYYASLPAPHDAVTPRPGAASAEAEQAALRLVTKGDPARLITPCVSCHGVKGQGGKWEAPALAGQNPLYFVRTMLDYHGGQRTNDAAKGMRVFAQRLTATEIDALAHYYADLPRQR
ncbi:c-type cytochrome [Tepidimonas sp.]|uniref:c-type cytochrome n=1 Tax=Tepidimonas sp. TaxID=2002775 RepID=UPI0028CF657A|nr:c-type cytochrome [Tepidimonas sp.]MDT7928986.1 c-type cytochrome [Tepidimonas sp.]